MNLWERLKDRFSHDEHEDHEPKPFHEEETDSIGSSITSLESLDPVDPLAQPASKKRRRAATIVFSAAVSAPIKRSGRALHTALTWSSARTGIIHQNIPKIVLDTPDGRSHTIYLKD